MDTRSVGTMSETDKEEGERVVRLLATQSFLMSGDPQCEEPAYKGQALPRLLHEGWRVKDIVADKEGGYILLTGKPTPEPARFEPPKPGAKPPPPRIDPSGGGGY